MLRSVLPSLMLAPTPAESLPGRSMMAWVVRGLWPKDLDVESARKRSGAVARSHRRCARGAAGRRVSAGSVVLRGARSEVRRHSTDS